MNNPIILITGGTGGIGKQTAIALASKGARVVVTGRDRDNAEAAVADIRTHAGNKNVDYLLADLSTIDGVSQLAAAFRQTYDRLDVLINNAGAAASAFRLTSDGLETNFAVNVVGPYLLSKLLTDLLHASPEGRIVTLMGGDLPSKLDLDNLQSEKGFKGLDTYSQTKVAMMCLMVEYAHQIEAGGVTCNICYPGQASTSMTQGVTRDMLPGFVRFLFPVFKLLVRPDGGQSARKASRSSVYLALSAEVAHKTGIYVDKNVRIRPIPNPASDPAIRVYVWNYVENILRSRNV